MGKVRGPFLFFSPYWLGEHWKGSKASVGSTIFFQAIRQPSDQVCSGYSRYAIVLLVALTPGYLQISLSCVPPDTLHRATKQSSYARFAQGNPLEALLDLLEYLQCNFCQFYIFGVDEEKIYQYQFGHADGKRHGRGKDTPLAQRLDGVWSAICMYEPPDTHVCEADKKSVAEDNAPPTTTHVSMLDASG